MSAPKPSLEPETREAVEGVPFKARLRVEADQRVDDVEVSVFLIAVIKYRHKRYDLHGKAVTVRISGLRPEFPEVSEVELVPERLPAPIDAGIIRIRHFLVADCRTGLLSHSHCIEPISYSRNPPKDPAPAERAGPQSLRHGNFSLPSWLLALGSMEAAAFYFSKGPAWPLAALAGWTALLARSLRRRHDFRILQALPEWGFLLPGRKCPIEIVLEANRDQGPGEVFVSLTLFAWAEWLQTKSQDRADRDQKLVGIASTPVPALSKGARHIGRVELDIPGDAPTSLQGPRWSIVYHLEVRVGESPGSRRTDIVEMGQPMKGLSEYAHLSLPDW